MGSISFLEENTSALWLQKNKIKYWIKTCLNAKGFFLGDINLILCNDAFLLKINQEHLKHDYYTDIITFDYSENSILSGDLIISIDRVIDNATTLVLNKNHELLRVVSHGILHLMGEKDKTDKAKKQMTMMENWFLTQIVPRETNTSFFKFHVKHD